MNQRNLGILLSYVNIVIQILVNFLYIPILLHYIGKSEYGLYQLIGSFIAYFSVMDFGLSAAVTRFYAKYYTLQDKSRMENILAIAVRCYTAVTILSLCIGVVCYTYLPTIFSQSMTMSEIHESSDIFLLLLFNIAVTLLTMVFRAVITARERFFFLKGLETVNLLLQPFLVVLVLEGHPSAFSVAAVQTSLNFMLCMLRIYYCFFKLHASIQFHCWDCKLLVSFKKLAISVFIVGIVDQIFWKTNQIILGIISGTESVAVYSIASLIYMNYAALSGAIAGVYLPHVTSLVTQKESIEKLSELFITIGRWQYYLLALVATGFILFGKYFIYLWAGNGFEDSYLITIIIIIPFTIDLIQNIGLAILQAENRYSFRAKVYMVVGMLNLLLAIPLGIEYGGIGCALATGLSMLLGNGLIMNWFYAKKVHLNIQAFWKQIGFISRIVLVCLGFGYAINELLPNTGIFLFMGKIIIYTVFYASGIYFFAMSKLEKEKIQGILTKFK